MPSASIPIVPQPQYLQGLPPPEAYPCVGNPQRRALYTDADCYIDPTDGSDSNRGTTAATAIRSWEEARRRYLDAYALNCMVSGRVLTFHILGDLPAVNGIVFAGPNDATAGRIVIQSESVAAKTSTLTGVTAKNPATNTFLALVDAGSPFTAANELAPIVFTNGPAAGAFCWGDIHTAGSLETSSPATIPNSFGTVLSASPANGNGYQLLSYPTIGNFGITVVGGQDFGTNSPCRVRRLRFSGRCEDGSLVSFYKVSFDECRFDGWFSDGSFSFNNCLIANNIAIGGGRYIFQTGLFKNIPNSFSSIGAGTVIQMGTEPKWTNCAELFRGRGGTLDILETICFRNCAAPLMAHQSRPLILDSLGPATRFWGAGNTDCLMKFYGGSSVAFGFANTLLTAVGGGGGYQDIKLGDGTRATARPTDPATGLPVAAAIATSFANWIAAPAAGFGRNLLDTINAITVGTPGGTL